MLLKTNYPTAKSINLSNSDFLPLIGTEEGGRSKARAEFAAAAEEEAKQRAIRNRIYVLKQRLQSQPYVDLAKELASLLGYHVDEVGGSLFKNAEYVVRRDYAEVGRFPSGPDFVMWVKGALLT